MLPVFCALAALPVTAAPVRPLALYPDNPRYFLFRGKPAVLITSGEHYGAVLNRDFDFLPYLDTLKARGFNLTRTFTGAYMENPGDFNIRDNTLAPARDRLICPWARSDTPGYAMGGNKFDLERWDDVYFRRLREFVRQAGRRGVVVEVVLFCPFYEDSMWRLSPMNAANNVNGAGSVPREEVYALKHPALTTVQEAMTRQVVRELRDFDNVYFEICNEPYFGGVTLEWQRRIAAVIADAEKDLPNKHLIAQNIANGAAKVTDPDPRVSILNFHYANPPDTVAQNWDLNRPIGFDESGFRGSEDAPYRTEAWEFLMAGGAVYSNLDYSYTTAHPEGTAEVHAPGGGGPALRRQLQVLRGFMAGLDFVRMRPDSGVIRGGVPEGAKAYVLVEPGRAFAVYLKGGTRADLALDAPAGRWRAEWINTRTGATDRTQDVDHAGGVLTLSSPDYAEDVALRLKRR